MNDRLNSTPVDPGNPDAGAYFTPVSEISRPLAQPGPDGRLPPPGPERHRHERAIEAPRVAPPLSTMTANPAFPQSAASPSALGAAQGTPVAPSPSALPAGAREYVLKSPIVFAGIRYERCVLRRLKWGEFEEAFGAAMSNQKPGVTGNQIMQSRITGLPLDVIQELDWEDGMQLFALMGEMYPLERLVKAPATGGSLSSTSSTPDSNTPS